MTTYSGSKPYVRSFRQWLESPEQTPDGGAIYKIWLHPDHFMGVSIPDLRLFVNGEWVHGGVGTVHSYVFFKDGDWYLYNSLYYPTLLANIIAVPGDMTEEEYYSVAIFTHRAYSHNTMVPECDNVTKPEDHYVSYIDDDCLNGRPDLMLILTQVAMADRRPKRENLHHFTVWYDPFSDYSSPGRVGRLPLGRWALAYPSRNAIKEGTCFNIMAMGMEAEEHHDEEPYMPRAFAFQHDVMLAGFVPNNPNTTVLDKALAEKLITQLAEFRAKYPHHYVPDDPVQGYNLIVIASEQWEGPDYTEEIIQRQFPREEWPAKMRELLGSLRPSSEVNMAPTAVWYIPPGYEWQGEPLPEDKTNKWAVYVNQNKQIDLIKLNICTRLPCPKWCDG